MRGETVTGNLLVNKFNNHFLTGCVVGIGGTLGPTKESPVMSVSTNRVFFMAASPMKFGCEITDLTNRIERAIVCFNEKGL